MAGCNRVLHIDLETFSDVDLPSCGLYRYVESDTFQILLLAYAWDSAPVEVIDCMTKAGQAQAESLRGAILDPSVLKVAHNCAFERTCLGKFYGEYMPPEQWADTMVMAAQNGLPQTLAGAGAALNLPSQKMKEGEALIRYFCKPCAPTVANGGRERNLPRHAQEKWSVFKEYCKRDVEVEQAIFERLRCFPVPAWEQQVRCLDARINERGVMVDIDLAESAVAVNDQAMSAYAAELRRLTGLENPNSVSQLKSWLENAGYSIDSLNKTAVSDLLNKTEDPTIARVLQLRALMGKTSVKKYDAMLSAASPADHRLRGMMQYYGAGRTGRWAGRIVQPQNLPQNHLEDIGEVREIVRSRDLDTLELMYDSVPDVLSQLIRTALIAPPGHTFLVADYSAIEARVIAYLAGEEWRMEVFRNGGDIYCSSASQMFHVPVVKHGVNGHLRQKGKVAELACGYGGGIGALKNFGADRMGLTETEMLDIVKQWRAASPSIPRFWRDAEDAARTAILHPGQTQRLRCGVMYRRDRDALRCKLPSGRVLSYWGAYLDDDGHICFMALNQTTRKWERSETWGGKLVENIVQAFARDCLAVAMLRLDAAGYKMCFSVHDELIVEEPTDGRTWQQMADIMGQAIDWAPGLLLRADGYTTPFYMKD